MPHLVLLGGGHAHLFVLEALAGGRFRRPAMSPGPIVTLVSACRWHYYSGMLPGWIAGHYELAQCRIDLRQLCEVAGVRFIEERAGHLDARSRTVSVGRERIHYDLLSLDIGSETRAEPLQALEERFLPIKPLHAFVQGWQENGTRAAHCAVVGGGAGGVELALAIRHARDCSVTLICGESGVLSGHNSGLRRRAERVLHKAGVKIIVADATARDSRLLAGDVPVPADIVLGVTGPAAPGWLRGSGLQLDDAGYVVVDACHRSSDPHVFAAGDICSRADRQMARSGVHAVRAGPVLAVNLAAALESPDEIQIGGLQTYTPRRRVLYLLSCGRRYAIASWGNLSIQGHWVWYWKDWIDRRFIRHFTPDKETAETMPPDGNQL